MKTKLLLLILLVTKITFVNAQMDDKFYFPRKDIRPNEWEKTKEFDFKVENDTINTVFLQSDKKPKSYYFSFPRSWRKYYLLLSNCHKISKSRFSSGNGGF